MNSVALVVAVGRHSRRDRDRAEVRHRMTHRRGRPDRAHHLRENGTADARVDRDARGLWVHLLRGLLLQVR